MTSVQDKLQAILDRLARRSSEERVFLAVYADAARAEAHAADERRRAGLALGPLDGVIVSIKDLFDVAGEVTRAGSLALRERAPAPVDAVAVQRLRRAGAVIVGKTNMVEFAFSGLGLNAHFGAPGNAHDADRIPGGSSSGAGVSVAEGTSDIAIGSDTGGSVRIPAAMNGVVGFKPTARRVPLDGVFPLSPSLDSVGPLARTVQDCAFADAVMAGERPRLLVPLGLPGLTIGVPRGRLLRGLEPMVEEAFARSLRRLEHAGARIVDHPLEDLLDRMAEATSTASIASVEAAEVHKEWIDAKAHLIDPRIRAPIARSGRLPASAHRRMMRERAALAAAMDERLRPVDVLALPTTPISAPLIAPLEEDDDLYDRTDWLVLRNTMVANQFDLTSITLPASDVVRPVGFMLVARHGQDHRLLDIAAGIEAALRDSSGSG
ncbi:amidase [Microvirga pudoricolor]|uniref:amidase n=1 Tax=Microvirga pudoricolor TaxID=2778729 RepID=UPI00194E1BFA|nr:amidase [Microvirga pudoricolor]MBM6593245.1 amidase [Microvirga pudoricolor]